MKITNPQKSNLGIYRKILFFVLGLVAFCCFDAFYLEADRTYYEDYVFSSNSSMRRGDGSSAEVTLKTTDIQAQIDAAVAAAVAKTKAETQGAIDAAVKEALVKAANEAIQPANSEAAPTSFRELGLKAGTDKVEAWKNLENCLKTGNPCVYPKAERETCRPWGHFYDTIYERYLAPYATNNSPPVQLLEIGYYKGKGFETYTNYLEKNQKSELHSIELRCDETHAKDHPWYQDLVDKKRLHCGDAAQYSYLHEVWTQHMKRPDAPPLKVVIDDGSHDSKHMATSLFFWFPRIEPGGIMVFEDIQPIVSSNKFRTKILTQVMKDIHWCGGTGHRSSVIDNDPACFPQISQMLQGIHCEMHICVFIRNNVPAREPNREDSLTPDDAFDKAQTCLFGSSPTA